MFDPLAVTLPLAPYRVTPSGEYDFYRASRGVYHPGLDMAPTTRNWDVVTPERVTVRYVDRDADGDESPLTKYGPGSVLVEGWRFSHVLAHLDPASIPAYVTPGAVLPAGTFVGRLSAGVTPVHLHWEVRTVLLSPRGEQRRRDTIHPRRWLALRQAGAALVVGAALVKLPIVAVVGVVAAVEVAARNAVARGSRT